MPTDPEPGASRLAVRSQAALDDLTNALPAGEHREAQREMCRAVAGAVEGERHLVVEAGTGTGKSLAYLVPIARSGKRAVVATATKALQDQLSGKDLPFVTAHDDLGLDFAVLKGRSNYVCRQRLAELHAAGDDDQMRLAGTETGPSPGALAAITSWAERSATGDRAELDDEPDPRTWAAVSMTAQECPGANHCPSGATCFAEAARAHAAEADVVVVNQHLWGLNLASDGMLLPEHDVVVIDEAHQLVDVVSATAGTELAESRFLTVARAARAVLESPESITPVETIAADWASTLTPLCGDRLPDGPTGALADCITLAGSRVEKLLGELRALDPKGHAQVATRRERALNLASSLIADLHAVTEPSAESVLWVAGPTTRPTLCCAPIDVSGLLADTAWSTSTAVLTSATIPPGFAETVGLPSETTDELRLDSPFDFPTHTLLYCPAELPPPQDKDYTDALHDELAALIAAAGGATLALFTSYRALDAAVEALRERVDVPILDQRERSKAALVAEFTRDRSTCLFATLSFFQGVDVPGDACQLVTIDRIPFPRPDDPLLSARRDAIGAAAFATIDVPRAATLLAQAAGRLVRRADDRGVVAVLDSRLATRRSYRWALIDALPPMPRTRHRHEAEAFLAKIRPD